MRLEKRDDTSDSSNSSNTQGRRRSKAGDAQLYVHKFLKCIDYLAGQFSRRSHGATLIVLHPKQLMSVPKSEIDKREAEYHRAKKNRNKKTLA